MPSYKGSVSAIIKTRLMIWYSKWNSISIKRAFSVLHSTVTVSATPMKWGHGSQAFLIRMYVSSMPSCFSQQVYFPDKRGGGIPREVLRILRHLTQSDHTKRSWNSLQCDDRNGMEKPEEKVSWIKGKGSRKRHLVVYSFPKKQTKKWNGRYTSSLISCKKKSSL